MRKRRRRLRRFSPSLAAAEPSQGQTYAASIYKGTLPPLVHAVVVIDTEVDGRGNVRDVHVVRSPGHAPDVTDDVERMVRSASPFPVPSGAEPQRFTEVWLVDRSGRFQLHTLTEGQRDH